MTGREGQRGTRGTAPIAWSIPRGAVAALSVVVVAGAAGWWWLRPKGGADRTDATQVALGQQLYPAHCAVCHGLNLEGQTNWIQELPTGGRPAPPHDESGHTWHHSDALLFDIIKRGEKAVSAIGYKYNMPAFGATLSDREIWAVLAYFKSTWSAESFEIQRRVTEPQH